MNKEIMTKGETTNIFLKICKKVWGWQATKILTFLIGFILFLYCLVAIIAYSDMKKHPYGDYEMTYRVHYTATTHRDYTIRHNRPIFVGVENGSNYVKKHLGDKVIDTTAPIEVVSYVNHKK